jgi:Icc protein
MAHITPHAAARHPSSAWPEVRDGIRLVQFSDMHLHADPAHTLLGLNTLDSFRQCLALARVQHWPADLVLATGDLAHDASPGAYARLGAMLAELDVPVAAIPGNHDKSMLLAASLQADNLIADGHLVLGSWQIVLLDSSLAGSEAGRLAPTQLEHLERSLAEHPDHHALICLHHPPLALGSRWLDSSQLQNPDDLFAVTDAHPQVRAVLWGHIHQEYRSQRQGVALIGSPSTCIQFRPCSDEFALDALAPGYRWLTLHSDGGVDTGVCRLPELPEGLELRSLGY